MYHIFTTQAVLYKFDKIPPRHKGVGDFGVGGGGSNLCIRGISNSAGTRIDLFNCFLILVRGPFMLLVPL